ncbi:MAG TPA: crosslink repair DNA glycosylase YcaQ family protein, partial [Kofleriaceae bacterium]|nr:crosslink repair DNA glycosylase YcaQ family protein [Kofleriaceae bacterium]
MGGKPRMAAASVAASVDLAAARAMWLARQGLAAPASGGIDAVLARTGWLRTLGGIEVYVNARARRPGLRRADLDAATDRGAVRVVPAARGCIYLVPAADLPAALGLAAELSRPARERELARAGVKGKEIDRLGDQVLAALAAGPLATDALRKALPAGAVRSLGEAGKKLGLSSPLPATLRELEFRGQLERVVESGRLDSERYLWRLVPAARRPRDGWPGGPELHRRVVERFLDAVAPVSAADVAAWAGLAQRDVRAALAALGAVPVAVDGYAAEAWVPAGAERALAEPAAAPPAIALLGVEDNFLGAHGGPGLLTDPAHHGEKVASWGSSKPTTLGAARHLANRPILLGDRLVGFWELDPRRGQLATGLLASLSKPQRAQLDERAADLAA